MKPISEPCTKTISRFDTIIVGTGYGGSVLAMRLAEESESESICLLERGLEKWPGEYPANQADAAREIQVRTADSAQPRLGDEKALLDFRLHDDVSTLVGCALGGTSIINANVALEMHKDILKEVDPLGVSRWPAALRVDGVLDPYYARAREFLDANEYPETPPKLRRLKKLKALRLAAKITRRKFVKPPIAVNFKDDGFNVHGVYQQRCRGCGDCVTGCNYGAKNTTLMNYLPRAKHEGVIIHTEITVVHLERVNAEWVIFARNTNENNLGNVEFRAKRVILAAGSLGSTEILLRSKDQGLGLSPALGTRFSGNGDVLAFGFDSYWHNADEDSATVGRVKHPVGRDEAIYAIGVGENPVPRFKYPGPTITGMIDSRDTATEQPEFKIPEFANDDIPGGPIMSGRAGQGLLLQEGAIPGALAAYLSRTFLLLSAYYADPTQYGIDEARTRIPDARDEKKKSESLRGQWRRSYDGFMSRTQTYLVMGHDDSGGRIKLNNGVLDVQWPGAGKHSQIQRSNNVARLINNTLHGQFIPNPLWDDALGNRLLTVHPLGGCPMGDDQNLGVVDDIGQVYTDTGGKHEGLYVCDGSIIPTSLGANPLLTICALAERTADRLVGRTSGDEPPPPEDISEQYGNGAPLRIRWRRMRTRLRSLLTWLLGNLMNWFPGHFSASLGFSETLDGFVEVADLDEHPLEDVFKLGDDRGEVVDSKLNCNFEIHIPNLAVFISEDRHRGVLSGEIELLGETLAFEDGTFQLFVIDNASVETWRMVYRFWVEMNNRRVEFVGNKNLHLEHGSHWWTDVTELDVDIRVPTGNVIQHLQGICRLNLNGLVGLAASMKLELHSGWLQNSAELGPLIRRIHSARFVEFFGITVFRAYGNLLAFLDDYIEGENVRLKENRRLIRAPAPQMFPIKFKNSGRIKLTRYKGGNEGPVILAPGFSVNASSFAMTTVGENLVEFLVAQNYDVWLFDYRASPEGSPKVPFDIDDIALEDWPAAVQMVLDNSNHERVQIIAHCVGSMSLLMSLMRGKLAGQVRSIICSQLTLHPVTDWLNYLKADLDLVDVLRQFDNAVVRDNIRIAPDKNRSMFEKAADKALDTLLWKVPVPRGETCMNPICRRISALFGPSWNHNQLNHETHMALSELFKNISLKALDHLSLMVKIGHVVDRDGNDSYLTPAGAQYLANTSITFFAGRENRIFYPETSLRTFNWLRAMNPGNVDYYRREIIDDYGHMDCFIGKNASRHIFPWLLDELQNPPLP